jgi:hypothetical protein
MSLAAATTGASDAIRSSTIEWTDVHVPFKARAAPYQFAGKGGGASYMMYELHSDEGVLTLAAAGQPAVLRAVLAEAALRFVEKEHAVQLGRSALQLRVSCCVVS